MNMDQINEFKIEKIERQSRNLGAIESTLLMQYAFAGFELGLSLISLNPFCLLSSLVYFMTAESNKEMKKDIEMDIEKVKSIKNEEDLEEYKIERIESCKKKMNTYKQEEHFYAISTAIAMGGFVFAPATWIVPVVVLAYGALESMLNKYFYSGEIKSLSNENEQNNSSSKEKVKVKSRTPIHNGNVAYEY